MFYLKPPSDTGKLTIDHFSVTNKICSFASRTLVILFCITRPLVSYSMDGLTEVQQCLLNLQLMHKEGYSIFIDASRIDLSAWKDTCSQLFSLNLIQGLRYHAGLEEVLNPEFLMERTLASQLYRNSNGFNDTKVHDINDFIKWSLSAFIPDKKFNIDSRALNWALNNFKNDGFKALKDRGIKVINSLDLDQILENKEAIHLVSFLALKNGKLLGGHTVIVNGKLGDNLLVQDPNFPGKVLQMGISNVTLKTPDGSLKTTQLLPTKEYSQALLGTDNVLYAIHSVHSINPQ